MVSFLARGARSCPSRGSQPYRLELYTSKPIRNRRTDSHRRAGRYPGKIFQDEQNRAARAADCRSIPAEIRRSPGRARSDSPASRRTRNLPREKERHRLVDADPRLQRQTARRSCLVVLFNELEAESRANCAKRQSPDLAKQFD
jgi:hypothetical protein